MPLPPGFFDDATEQARTEQVVETRRPAQSEDRDDAELRLADSTPSQTRDEEVTSKQASTEQETESNMTNEMKEFLAFAATVPDDALEAEAPAAAGQTTSPPNVHRGSAKAAVSINENRVVEEESRALNSGDEQQGPQSEETNVIQQSHNTEGEEGVEEEEEEEEEEYKMVMCVNMDLKMGKGKIAAQCCHACLGSFRRAPEKYVRPWARSGQPKIAVKCKDVSELEDLAATAQELNLPYYLVADAGRTQIAAGSRTVCAIGPAPKEVIDLITGHLKLL
mmetsp:Transcript_9667/g.17810  ORF Transcript_9667/g.17810 Transcript_9667/m.17810 type:complete len:279 (+) Transcript_9667:125-961(+)